MSWIDRVRPALRAIAGYDVPPHPCRVKLDANESPFAPSPALAAAIAEATAAAPLHRYPDPHASRLRAVVAAHLGQAPERLVFGNGSDELISILCQTFAAPQQDGGPARVVFPGPTFVVYRIAALAAGLEVVEAPLGPRFEADEGALFSAIEAARPNLVFVATPNNPTGTRWPRATLERMVERFRDTVLVIDEAYVAYAGESHLDLVERGPHVISLRTYSKVGLAGLRLGVAVAQPEAAREIDKARGPYNLGLLPQLAGEIAIGGFADELTRHTDEIVAERARLAAAMAALPGLELFASAANLILVRVDDAPGLWRALLDRGVLVRNLHRPGGALADCLRVTVGTKEENSAFLAALGDALRERSSSG